MKKLILLAFMALPLSIMAQKLFTLDDLIPGGSTYRSTSVPENKYYAWWGDVLVELGQDRCTAVQTNPLFVNEQVNAITLDAINAILAASNLKPIHHFYYATFPYPSHTFVKLPVGNSNVIVDWVAGKVVWHSDIPVEAANVDWNKVSMHTAYTIGHNLYVQRTDGHVAQVSQDGGLELTYGESVHRDEFGISKGIFWNPTGTSVAFYRMDQSMVSQYPQVNVTPYDDSQVYASHDSASIGSRSAIVEPDPYPMAGETSHKVSIGVYTVATNTTVYLQTADPTDRYFTNIAWSPDGSKIYVMEVNRDQTTGELIEYDSATGQKLRTLFTETNERYFEPMHPIQFLPWDPTKFIYQTRRDGYNHIYLYNIEGKQLRQLTKGAYEVVNVLGFNTKTQTVLYTSNQRDPLQVNVYIVDMKSKNALLGNSTGWHANVEASASGRYIVDNYSSPQIARHIDVLDTQSASVLNIFSASDPWRGYKVPEMKAGSIKAADGVTDLYYRLILPTDFDPSKKYPAIVYVYGGPHAHNVDASRNWGARGWDIWMAQKGYVMFCIDNRGSEHRGLAFEQATFRHLGVEEMKDQLCGVDFLKSLPYVDASRLGVHGWSFGGFMTTSLMTSFSDAETGNPYIFKGESPFKVGVAGGPVIDWKFYEVMYGERYMDTPQTNPEGYANTSLLNKAQNLKGRLMIIYGGNDPTCVPQHTLSFIRACIDAGTYPDLFTYPGDGHNMSGTDRIHLHHTITRYFEDHLK